MTNRKILIIEDEVALAKALAIVCERLDTEATLCASGQSGLQHLAQAASSPCNSPNGNLFNLEPRPNAVVQVARSLAVLPNPAGNNNLVLAVGADARGLEGDNSPIINEDAFYVERSGSD